MRPLALLPFLSVLTLASLLPAQPLPEGEALTGDALWADYARAPYQHSHLPNCSFAGFQGGESPRPKASLTLKLSDFGARPDAEQDCSEAFRSALRELGAKGGGLLLLEEGRYRLDSWIRIETSNIVIQGRGAGKTLLDFSRPLDLAYARNADHRGVSKWSWLGGLIWIGAPAAPGPRQADRRSPPDAFFEGSESWRGGPLLATVTEDAPRGARTLTVDHTSNLREGQWVLLVLDNPADASLLREAYGHAPTALLVPGEGCGSCLALLPPRMRHFLWPVRIQKIEGTVVTLAQHLRLSATVARAARLQTLEGVVHQVGLEGLSLLGHARPTHEHLKGDGWNGVYLNQAIDCWVRDVEGIDLENGVILAAAKQCTVSGLRLSGSSTVHHALACRVLSCDNLFEKFVVDGPQTVMHGVNVEGFSSGNVWRQGRLERGTFDTHRALPFDSLYTDIYVANDRGAWLGGSSDAGPQLGRSTVRWNIVIASEEKPDRKLRGGTFVNQPRLLPLGALVGVRGAPPDLRDSKTMPPGDKDTLLADVGKEPNLKDLYLAQRALRLQQEHP